MEVGMEATQNQPCKLLFGPAGLLYSSLEMNGSYIEMAGQKQLKEKSKQYTGLSPSAAGPNQHFQMPPVNHNLKTNTLSRGQGGR